MIGRLLLLAVSGILGVLLAEVVLTLVAPQIHRLPTVWEPDERLGWRHIPGARGRLINPEFDVEYRIDDQGRRSHKRVSAAATRIVLFGDSFAEGWGVDVDAGLAARLEASLAASGRPAAVDNYAVAGYGTDQSLLLYEATPGVRGADLVLLLFYANDLWNNMSRRGIGAQRGRKPYFLPGISGRLRLEGVPVAPPPRRKSSAWRYLGEHLHLAALLHRALQPPPVSSTNVTHYYGGLYGRDQSSYGPVWDLTEKLLARFAERTRLAEARFVLVYAPAIIQIEADDWRTKRDLHDLTGDYDLDQPSRRLAAIAERHRIPWIDLLPDFRRAARDTVLFHRDSHWNEAGHRVAAAAVARFLKQRALLPGPPVDVD